MCGVALYKEETFVYPETTYFLSKPSGLCFIIKDASPLFGCIPHFFAFCVDSTVPVLYTERYGIFAADRAARLYSCKEKEEMP